MTPKEKAIELVCKMYGCHKFDLDYVSIHFSDQYQIAKDNALIAVDEILNAVPQYFYDSIQTYKGSVPVKIENCEYYEWLEVRKEIEAL